MADGGPVDMNYEYVGCRSSSITQAGIQAGTWVLCAFGWRHIGFGKSFRICLKVYMKALMSEVFSSRVWTWRGIGIEISK